MSVGKYGISLCNFVNEYKNLKLTLVENLINANWILNILV